MASAPVIAFQVRAADLLTAWGPGTYAMRVYLLGVAAPVGTGRFTLVETPVPS